MNAATQRGAVLVSLIALIAFATVIGFSYIQTSTLNLSNNNHISSLNSAISSQQSQISQLNSHVGSQSTTVTNTVTQVSTTTETTQITEKSFATVTTTTVITPSGNSNQQQCVLGLYVVQPGDTIFSIGARYGIPWQVLAFFNGLSNSQAMNLQPGQVLYLPAIVCLV